MKFYEVQQALEAGKKIRLKSKPDEILYMGKITKYNGELEPSLIREQNGDWSHTDLYGRWELFADDWEIIDNIPTNPITDDLQDQINMLKNKLYTLIEEVEKLKKVYG